MRLNYYHRCYTATVTPTAGSKTSASYTVLTPVNSLTFGSFISNIPSTTTPCDVDLTLWFANGTQVLSGVQSAFVLPLEVASNGKISVSVIHQSDNFNVNLTPYSLIVKAAVRYGTNVGTLAGTFEIKGNPCITASVTLPSTPTTIMATLTVAKGPF